MRILGWSDLASIREVEITKAVKPLSNSQAEAEAKVKADAEARAKVFQGSFEPSLALFDRGLWFHFGFPWSYPRPSYKHTRPSRSMSTCRLRRTRRPGYVWWVVDCTR